MNRCLLFITCICLLLPFNAASNVYTVSSNANSGTGTLRQAISDANTHNGADSIKFNISDSSVIGRSISLSSALPTITGQVIIDGTSQNKGAAFGISNTKILVTASISIAQCFNVSADNCEIYGIYITGFQTGILVNNAFSQIGGINKGNVFVICSVACIKLQSTDHSAIVGNLIGVDTSGHAGAGLAGDGIDVITSYAISIGGHSGSASNVISGNSYGIKFQDSQYGTVNGNFIGTSGDGLTAIPNQFGIKATGDNANMQIGGDSVFKRNIISGNTSSALYGNFTSSVIQGNYIGTDVTGNKSLANGAFGIYLREGSSDNMIGGETEFAPNLIAYNGQEAISFEASTCINNTVRRNITYCNSKTLGNGGLKFNNGNNHLNPPQLTIANALGVTGLTYPSGIVDLFQDDSCIHCEGKSVIASVTAAANGVFVYSDSLIGIITATVTDTTGNTSEYTVCTATDNSSCITGEFITIPSGICTGTVTSFMDQTVTKPGSVLQSWLWDFGDGGSSSQQFPTHVYASNGTYTISMVVSNNENCSDTVTKTITVTGAPVASFQSVSETCAGSLISFIDQSTAGNGATLTSWHWDFGDGGSDAIQNPLYTFDSIGNYMVTLTATNSNGCTAVSTQTINVISQPVASFSFVENGLAVTFTNTSATSGYASYSWNFGDGIISNAIDPVHVYSNFGNFSACLSVYDSLCSSTDSICAFIDLPDGIQQTATPDISLFPNPANNYITLTGVLFPSSIIVWDINGNKIFQQALSAPLPLASYKVDASLFPEGIYLLEIISNAAVISRKISIIH